jgi:hypothetical protein
MMKALINQAAVEAKIVGVIEEAHLGGHHNILANTLA